MCVAKRVSIFSNDPGLSTRLHNEIKQAGYDAVAHPLDAELIMLAKQDRPAAIILDADMSWSKVAPLITDLKSEFELRDVKIITSSSDPASQERMVRFAVHNLYLVDYPLDSKLVVAQLKRLLGKPI
jgi:DNA-binding response OmpR family regulator